MIKKDQVLKTEDFVRQNIKKYDSGHDWWHIERVRKLALYINEKEALADPFTVDIAALLHDTADSKFAEGKMEEGYSLISDFMDECELSDIKDQVLNVIKNISFSNKKKTGNPDDPLLWVIQDADRLDAIGAIGIARAFNYGGFRNNSIYSRLLIEESRKIQANQLSGHFYEKLLKF